MNKALYFIVGAAIGSVSTWFLVKKYYEDIANEEIESVREVFSRDRDNESVGDIQPDPEPIKERYDNPREIAKEAADKPNIMEYASKLRKEKYTNYSDHDSDKEYEKESTEGPHYIPEPYDIAPEHFGEDDDFETISLTLYSDGVVADDADEIMEDTEDKIGENFEEYFGKYDDEVAWVRNEKYKVEYEICKDNRTYEEVSGNKPKRVELT